MKVYRYMSLKEFQKFSAGVTIEGKKFPHCYTDSVGVCFLPEKVEGSGYDPLEDCFYDVKLSPEKCFRFLGGIVSDEVLVEFEGEESLFTKSNGIYADVYGGDGTMRIKELCIDSYNRDILTATGYYIFPTNQPEDGVWYRC